MAHKEIPNVRKVTIIRDQIERWRNTHYDASISHAVGKTINDQRMMDNATTTMGNALKAIDVLEKMLADLGGEKGEDDED